MMEMPRIRRSARHTGRGSRTLLEGPSFDRGNLYVTNIPYGQILKVSSTGEFSLVVEYDGEPNGLKIHRDGRIAGIGTTNAAYGGPERKTLYITDSETGTILSTRLKLAGKVM
jgi:sugar lactone lactonase YvrE